MGRQLKEAQLTTRSARQKLPDGLYWRAIDPDIHLGYRKAKRTGRWVVRWRVSTGYHRSELGTADDAMEADGFNTRDYAQAVAAARAHVRKTRIAELALGPVPTVRSACEAYGLLMKARKPKGTDLPGQRLTNHVLGDSKISELALADLTAKHIRNWREKLREKNIAETTVRRISNDFRAALNTARRANRSSLPTGLSDEIKDGFEITADDPPADPERPNIILNEDQLRSLLLAARLIDEEDDWEGDLYHLVLGLAATGARFSQLAKLPIDWFQPKLKRILVPSSKKGRSKQERLPAPVSIGGDVIVVLCKAAGARTESELLFMRWGYKRDKGLSWRKFSRRAWQAAEISKPFKKIVSRAGLSPKVTAYALRHTSIARQLLRGTPVRLVAARHDTSIEMIERYYSKFIVYAVDERSDDIPTLVA